jgi:hypothetical protein
VSSRSARMPGTEDCAPPTRSHGRDGVPAVRRERLPPGPALKLQGEPIGEYPFELRQVGRDRVLAVRKNAGQRGLCPSHKVPREGRRPRRPQGKAAPAARTEAGACPNQRAPFRAPTGWEGPRPRGPQECRAKGTVPLPQGPKRGTASPPSVRKADPGGLRRTSGPWKRCCRGAAARRPGAGRCLNRRPPRLGCKRGCRPRAGPVRAVRAGQ